MDRGAALGMSFPPAKIHKGSEGDRFLGGDNTDQDLLNKINFQDLAGNDLSAAFLQVAELDPKERHGAYLTIYDEWSRGHPGEQVDLNALPLAARNMWRDLSVLGPLEKK